MKVLLVDKEIIHIIQDFVILQEAIMLSFQSQHNEIKDWNYMIGCPSAGVISAAERTWNFYKHGSGTCFRDQKNAAVVDIIKWRLNASSAFDATRLVEYFTSRNLNLILFRGKDYDVSNERDMYEIIEILIEDKLIYETADYPQLYILR